MRMVFGCPSRAGIVGREDTGSVQVLGDYFWSKDRCALVLSAGTRGSRRSTAGGDVSDSAKRRFSGTQHLLSRCLLLLPFSLVLPLLSRAIAYNLVHISKTVSQQPLMLGCSFQGGWQIFDAHFLPCPCYTSGQREQQLPYSSWTVIETNLPITKYQKEKQGGKPL